MLPITTFICVCIYFQVILTSLVYEKQHRLRIMMKMHGLGDGPYWMISYAYFLAISTVYMICFVAFGAGIGSYSITELFAILLSFLNSIEVILITGIFDLQV